MVVVFSWETVCKIEELGIELLIYNLPLSTFSLPPHTNYSKTQRPKHTIRPKINHRLRHLSTEPQAEAEIRSHL
jgi:hypothetical protein